MMVKNQGKYESYPVYTEYHKSVEFTLQPSSVLE